MLMDTIQMEVEYEGMAMEEGCVTPKRGEFQIPVTSVPPPPPRKKRYACRGKKKPPKTGYFQPPDLELLFAMPPRRQACA